MTRYLYTFGALVALTTLTLLLSFVPLGAWAMPAAMAIALVKAVLVALYFMHLVEHRTSSWVAFAVSVLLAMTLVGLAWLDVISRTQVDVAPPL